MTNTTTFPVHCLLPGDVIVRDQFGDADRTGLIMDIAVGDSGVYILFSAARSDGSRHATFEISEDVEANLG